MLRIMVTSRKTNKQTVCLVLEGQIRADWCGMLERVTYEFLRQDMAVMLDMSGVTYVDDRGVRLIRELLATRTTMTGGNMFVQALIERKPVATPKP